MSEKNHSDEIKNELKKMEYQNLESKYCFQEMKMNHDLRCNMMKENIERNKKDPVDLHIEKCNNLELKRKALGDRITDLKLK